MVCYIEQCGEELTQCSTRGELRDAVLRAVAGQSRVLAVWPGRWKSDLFEIDDLVALAAKIELDSDTDRRGWASSQ